MIVVLALAVWLALSVGIFFCCAYGCFTEEERDESFAWIVAIFCGLFFPIGAVVTLLIIGGQTLAERNKKRHGRS